MVENHLALAEVVLIHGPEDALADRGLEVALAARSDFERTVLMGSELEVGRFSDAVAPSLFSEKRVIVIKDLQDVISEVAEEIQQFLEQFEVEPNLNLIFLHAGGVKGKGLIEKIKKLKAEYILCEPLKKASDKAEFVKSEFARHGRKISPSGIDALVDATGNDSRELASACSQIASDTDPKKSAIDESDISKYYQGRVEATGFDVADAVILGDVKNSLVSLRNALESGTDPIMIISAIASSVRALAKVSDAPKHVKSFELAGSLGMAPWQIDKARRQLSKWRPGMITFAITELSKADIGVKGGEVDGVFALERAVLAIAENVARGGAKASV
jgi:DNA polymerase-3 subunit delta